MTDCKHAWQIAPATERYSPGTCRLCGETRQFENSTPHIEGVWNKALMPFNDLSQWAEDVRRAVEQANYA